MSPGLIAALFLRIKNYSHLTDALSSGHLSLVFLSPLQHTLWLSQAGHTSSAELSCPSQSRDKELGKTHWQKNAKPLSYLT